MKIPKVTTIDFETFGIEGRPSYPPAPVSVSIKSWGKKPQFYAWGHPTDNNCRKADAVKALKLAYANPDGILCHHGKFDVDVAETHLGLKPPPWQKIHETVFLLFLDNPHGRDYGLKPSAKRVLGLEPEERDALVEWLREHYVGSDGKKIKPSEAGAYIAYAPGTTVVGPYADGDVKRTELLFKHLYPKVVEAGMLQAYNRERELMPILLDMERRGVRVDLARLRADVRTYQGVRARLDAWVRKRLRCGPEVNLQSGAQLLAAMEEAGVVDTSLMPLTKKAKKISTNKVSLALGVTDKQLAAVLAYDSQLHTCLATFMEPWLATAEKSGGLIYTHWNQTPSTSGGARTGRFSSSPNFQNIPREFKEIFAHEEASKPKDERKGLPPTPIKDIPTLPLCRGYIAAYEDQVLCGRDFSSQELRVLAHFEDGQMLQGYVENPSLDLHQYAADMITRLVGIKISRKDAKTVAFSILYGSGIAHLADGLGCSYDDAKKVLNAYLKTFPGVDEIKKDLKARARDGLPLKTIGGRLYYCEPPMIINGRVMTFEYRLLNHLIQASSADLTKDSMIRFYNDIGPGYLLLSIHDELVISTKAKDKIRHMEALKKAMNNAGLDVPMLSDGKWGKTMSTMEASDGV